MSKGKIIKAPFVAMSDVRKEIKTVDPNDPRIIQSHKGSRAGSSIITEHNMNEEAIDDSVIDGSNHMEDDSVSELIENAQQEVERILEAARLEAEQLKEAAKQEGYDAGYNTGYVEGQEASTQLIDEKMAEMDAQGNRLIAQLEEEKQQYMSELEPKIAYVIKELVTKLVGKCEDDPSLIIYLIRLGFDEIQTYGSFVIKVSDEDFDYVMENQETLTYGLSEKVSVEILKDSDMKKNECYIETEIGNLDCSLNLRLESLAKELQLIGDSLK